jgi:transcriptional regulator with XRE-family HTH domain
VARLRGELGITQGDLAAMTKRSGATIKAVEIGKLALSPGLARDIAEATGAGVEWLLGNDLGLPVPKVKRAAQRTKERIEWIQCYRQYLESAYWLEKRRKVLERCRWVCEGCGNRRAVEVHHLRYPQWPVLPGSEAWRRLEKLYDLVGLCGVCHGEVHE